MTDNAQKTPLVASLDEFARKTAADAIRSTGRALPASVVSRNANGTIVTVKFEVNSTFTIPNVTIPMFGPEYVRYPIKAGDRGMVVPADAYLGGMSGLGGGVADLSQRANLTALMFVPFGNTGFSTDVDPNQVTIYGPRGVTLRDTSGRVVVTLTPQGIVIDLSNQTLLIRGNLQVTGEITGGDGTADEIGLRTHRHDQGPDGRGDAEQRTTPPVPGT